MKFNPLENFLTVGGGTLRWKGETYLYPRTPAIKVLTFAGSVIVNAALLGALGKVGVLASEMTHQ